MGTAGENESNEKGFGVSQGVRKVWGEGSNQVS
jgi:hypothetical protein